MSNRDAIKLNQTYNRKKFKFSSRSDIRIEKKQDQEIRNKRSKKISSTGEGMERREAKKNKLN